MINRIKNRKLQDNSFNISPINTRISKQSKSPNSSNTGRNHTPNTLRYSKHTSRSPFMTRHPRLFKTENLTTEPASTLLQTVKSRRFKPTPTKPSPKLAQTVLKLYFLPFFQEQHKLEGDKHRQNSFNSPKKPSKQSLTPLSEILKTLLKQKQSELLTLRSKLNSILTEKKQMKNSLKSIKNSKFLSDLNFYSLPQASTQISNQSNTLSLCHSEKLSFFKVYIENILLQKKYSIEKSCNDDLKNHCVQFEFYHNQHYMTNQIAGESLRGAYYSLTALKHPTQTEHILKSITSTLKTSNRTKVTNNDSGFLTFSIIFADSDKIFTKVKTVIKDRADIIKELKSMKTAIVSYVENTLMTLKVSIALKQNISEVYETKEKEFFNFIEEYKSVQNEVEEHQRAARNNNQQLLCKFCNKEFLEADNFNWSCCSHPSEWGGEMYWCCGAKTQLSIGCQKRKHETRNEEFDENFKFFEFNKDDSIDKFCSGCKRTGHSSAQCAFDPNNAKRKIWKVRAHKKRVEEINKLMKGKMKWKDWKGEDGEGFEDIERMKRGNLTGRETGLEGMSGGSSPGRSTSLTHSSSFTSRRMGKY